MNITKWQLWFAWYPVYINGECIWLDCVYRRKRIIIQERKYSPVYKVKIVWEYWPDLDNVPD